MSKRASLEMLEDKGAFQARHIGLREHDVAAMLAALGLSKLEDLVDQAVPGSIRMASHLDMPGPRTESEALAELREMADQNRVMKSLIGLGYHDTITPPVIQRNLLENPGWYTAYTPYQAEISQGRLEALLNYQQMVIDLTGLEMANASLLDEATAAAEAMTLMHRVGKSKAEACFVAADCHPQTIAVLETRAKPLGIELVIGDPAKDLVPEQVFGVILQYPNTYGSVEDYRALVEAAHGAKALVTVCTDLMSLVLLTPPGEWGADVVVGNAQRFGVPLGYGGPHAAFMATRDTFKRSLPGRVIGVSVDSKGRTALRMALQTREQHIRREKATSNICTAQVLLANISGFYAAYHGPEGLRRIAERIARLTAILAEGLRRGGLTVGPERFFDTLRVKAAPDSMAKALAAGFNLRDLGDGEVGLSLNETTTREDVDALWQVFLGADHGLSVEALDKDAPDGLPDAVRRRSAILTHPVFNSHHSETEMLRYLRRLMDKDIALDQAMIPLGSCTMKLNATAEMMPITWPEFANIHPFAPLDQAEGYLELFRQLETMLEAITGFDAVSLQPNAGSQGEYSGLLAIRAYHASRGESDRNVCLIPSSAHGTNPASAIMAGMSVVVVDCDENGNVDVADLRAKAEAAGDRLAALMITYPSTHGVFEAAVKEICQIIHDQGGQVYLDGANLNAMVGLAKPAELGADVMHMNLHKTFCIPHGGGGPGVGPIGVVAHLAPFLPNHPLVAEAGPASGMGPVAAAPWGSASILPISWAYIRMMGAEGLTLASEIAVLSANYIAKRLEGHFDVLYRGEKGFVAHECIIDVRPLKDSAEVTVDDIAKRLVDYGFHAPTMSWPVAGTLMVEPTESEPKAELDRFCDAMIAIRKEAKEIEAGKIAHADSPLAHAPHTAEDVMASEWTQAYSREQAAYPAADLRERKYWPPVSRIDNAYGDRHLVCTCPAVDSYREAAE